MTSRELAEIVSRVAAGAKVIVVSNREPYLHERVAEGIQIVRPASGMAAALSPIVHAVGGTWVAHGAGSADRLVVDEKGRIELPPEDPKFVLRKVWLTRQEEKGYYYGLSNTALWPLCHTAYKRPFFSRSDWEIYRSVNRKFADVVLEEAGSDPAILFVQDYHLALLPRFVKSDTPDIKVIHFWHIPWPNPEAFRIFPWGEELLDGMLGNDLLGFHIQYHCNNFLQTVERTIEAMVDYEDFRIFRGGRPTYVRPFPISVNFEQIGRDVDSPTVEKRTQGFLQEMGDIGGLRLFVGADRIDYTKGILERLRAFDLMLQRHPELAAKVVLVQLAAPSRTHVEAYRKLNDAMDELVDEINWRHQEADPSPLGIRLRRNAFSGRPRPGGGQASSGRTRSSSGPFRFTLRSRGGAIQPGAFRLAGPDPVAEDIPGRGKRTGMEIPGRATVRDEGRRTREGGSGAAHPPSPPCGSFEDPGSGDRGQVLVSGDSSPACIPGRHPGGRGTAGSSCPYNESTDVIGSLRCGDPDVGRDEQIFRARAAVPAASVRSDPWGDPVQGKE